MQFLQFRQFHFARCLRSVLLAVGILSLSNLSTFAFQMEEPVYTEPDYTAPEMESMPPYADYDWADTQYNQPVYIDVLLNDFGISAPIDPSTLTIVTLPQHGTAEIDPNSGWLLYTPDPGFDGFDWFEYTVADTEGNVSNVAPVSIDVINMPPDLIDFSIREGSLDVWYFEGHVSDENNAGVKIYFGGLLEGESVDVNPDGSFSFSKLLDHGEEGGVQAIATDELGESSSPLWDEVYRYGI